MSEKPNKSNRRIIAGAVVLLCVGFIGAIPLLKAMRARAGAIKCGNQMCSLALVGRLWAQEHEGRFPPSLPAMTNEIGTTRLFLCPADNGQTAVTNWWWPDERLWSYELVTPNLEQSKTNDVFMRCKIHGYTSYSDGSWSDGNGRHGKWSPF